MNGQPPLGNKGAIYSLPQNLTVGGSEGPEIPVLGPEISGPGKFGYVLLRFPP